MKLGFEGAKEGFPIRLLHIASFAAYVLTVCISTSVAAQSQDGSNQTEGIESKIAALQEKKAALQEELANIRNEIARLQREVAQSELAELKASGSGLTLTTDKATVLYSKPAFKSSTGVQIPPQTEVRVLGFGAASMLMGNLVRFFEFAFSGGRGFINDTAFKKEVREGPLQTLYVKVMTERQAARRQALDDAEALTKARREAAAEESAAAVVQRRKDLLKKWGPD